MRQLFLIVLCLSFFLSVGAQSRSGNVRGSDPLARMKQKEANGRVIIWLDTLIEDNYNKHLIQGSKQKGVKGWRIRVFSDNGFGAKEDQQRERARFISLFPEIPTYAPYERSYYKIYVGDYRTKREAMRQLELIEEEFHDAFIVEDYIRLKN